MQRGFQQIDVFGTGPLSGNPVAVVTDGDGLTTDAMRAFSRWTNLSECTFLLPPTTPAADYRVRIFSLDRELPFAGHPTLGTARAWLEAGGRPRTPGEIVQECGLGLVPVRVSGELLAFAAPPLSRSGPVAAEDLDPVLAVLGVGRSDVVDAAWLDNGPGWIGVLLADAATVLALEPDAARAPGPGPRDIGVVGPYPAGSEVAIELRAFFPDASGTLREDPVTGSLNAAAAQWLLATGRVRAPYLASQGARPGRAGRIHVSDDGALRVGGRTAVVVRGVVDL